jgi:hypothetical protein
MIREKGNMAARRGLTSSERAEMERRRLAAPALLQNPAMTQKQLRFTLGLSRQAVWKWRKAVMAGGSLQRSFATGRPT